MNRIIRKFKRSAFRCKGRILGATRGFMDPHQYVDEIKKIEIKERWEFLDLWSEVHVYGPADDLIISIMESYRNKRGDYVFGSSFSGWVNRFIDSGIDPELAYPSDSVCCVGWSERKKTYYGWSHRAICGFEIGDRIFEVDFSGKSDNTSFKEHGTRVIKSKFDARVSAMNFAKYVS